MAQPSPGRRSAVVPAPTLEKIRPEVNLEKWLIWQPSKSKTQPQPRVIEREITSGVGDKMTGRLRVGYTERGPLTTEDQKLYYALVKNWEEHGRPAEYTPFSLRRISKLLNRQWGTNVIDSLTESLMRLRGTLLVWENSYFDNTTRETAELIETFTILSELKIIRKKVDGVVNREVGYVRFNDFTMRNLQTNHTKPVLFEVVLSFRSEIAQLLYTHVDLILAVNPFHERRTKELFDDLGITGTAYKRRPSKRKKVLEAALRELQGVPLSRGGIIASATIERTKDQKDFKVVFRKGAARSNPELPDTNAETSPVPALPVVQSPIAAQADELLRHFHKLFFGVETSSVQRHHRDLATVLVAQHGIELAKYIIDFSYREATRTRFRIATFGGLMQYIPRAVAAYERETHQRERQENVTILERAEAIQEQMEGDARKRAERRYRALSREQQEALRERYRAALVEKDPTWGQPTNYGEYPLLDVAIKAAIVNDFIREERSHHGEDEGEETISSANA